MALALAILLISARATKDGRQVTAVSAPAQRALPGLTILLAQMRLMHLPNAAIRVLAIARLDNACAKTCLKGKHVSA